MRRIRSITELQVALDDDFAWRLRDIHGLRKAMASPDLAVSGSALRAVVAMLYAHWEGFITAAAEVYGAFLTRRNLRYSDVRDCFRALQTQSYVRAADVSRRGLFASNALLARILEMGDAEVRLPLDNHLANVGNLNFDLFAEIVELLGIDLAPYETKRILIDESLLRRRNNIAHGEYLLVDKFSASDLIEEIVGIMRAFKTDIENAVATQAYLKPTIA